MLAITRDSSNPKGMMWLSESKPLSSTMLMEAN